MPMYPCRAARENERLCANAGVAESRSLKQPEPSPCNRMGSGAREELERIVNCYRVSAFEGER